MRYRVHYVRKEFFRDLCIGWDFAAKHTPSSLPNPADLRRTHAALAYIEADSLEAVFIQMQGERWSPNGEARSLIEMAGLSHTSMSVGDIAVDEAGTAWMVDDRGFRELGAVPQAT